MSEQAAADSADVLIIGAGASGAAMAWSLAETKMHIVCLEQGPLMNPLLYPSAGRDYEARANTDFAVSPNVRNLPSDYPINEKNSPLRLQTSMASVAARFCMQDISPGFIPVIFGSEA